LELISSDPGREGGMGEPEEIMGQKKITVAAGEAEKLLGGGGGGGVAR